MATDSPEQVMSSPPIVHQPSNNIYEIRTTRRRLLILILLSLCGLVLPFSDSVYLPALVEIEHDLNASTILVDYTVSFYLITAGITGLIWGPLSDRFGRKMILLISFALFLAFTIVCIFARSIIILLIFRALQGGAISASFVVGQSAIVDMYPSDGLGFAMGLFLVPMLVGPILGPFVGGFLANAFGWRSTFVSLAIMAFMAFVMIIILVPETHHYFLLQRLSKLKEKQSRDFTDKELVVMQEANTMRKPIFLPPWRPFVFLTDMTITPHMAVCNLNFSIIFILFTLMSNREAQPPYSLSTWLIGLSYIPTGVSSLIGSILGGWVSDWSIRRYPYAIEYRLLFNAFGSLTCPIGVLLAGWTFHYGVHIVVPLIGAVLITFGETFMFTGTSAFVTVKQPNMTGAILALMNSISFLASGIGIIVVVPLLSVMQFGPLFSLLAAILFVVLGISICVSLYQIRQSNAIRIRPDPVKVNDGIDSTIEKERESLSVQWF